MKHKKNIVIVGHGIAGHEVGAQLKKSIDLNEHDLIFIDQSRDMLFYPLLPDVMSEEISEVAVKVPLNQMSHYATRIPGKLLDVDLTDKTAIVSPDNPSHKDLKVKCDELILAFGTQSRTLPIPNFSDHVINFKGTESATKIKSDIEASLRQADQTSNPKEKKRLLTFVIIGGNLSGIELAGNLQSFIHENLNKYKNIRKEEILTTVLERGEHILEELNHETRSYVEKEHQKHGIKMMKDAPVTKVQADKIFFNKNQSLECSVMINCCGIEPTIPEAIRERFQQRKGI